MSKSIEHPEDHARSITAVTSGQSHTPVTWKVWSSLYEGMEAAIVHDVEPLRTIAEVRKFKDAALLAAAPELLAELKWCFMGAGNIERMGALIAKIEGHP